MYFLLLILFSLVNCISDPIIMEGEKWEEPLTEISGISEKQYNETKSKTEYNLLDLYTLALKSNEKIAIRYEKVRQAEAKKNIAFSMFLPSLVYRNQKSSFYPDTSNSRQKEEQKNYAYNALGLPSELYPLVSGNSTTSFNLPPTIRSGQRLVLHIPVFTGLNDYTNYSSAKSEILLRKLEMSHESRLLFTDIAHNYFSLLLLEKVLEQRKEALKITNNLSTEYSRRVYLGQARASELINFQTKASNLEADIFSLEEQYNAGKERIRFLTNIPVNAKINDEILLTTPNYSAIEAVQKLEERSDIRAAKTSLDISQKKVIGAKGEFLPNVYVDGIYNFPQGNSRDSFFAQFILEIPIFSGGKTIAAIQETESLHREAELNLRYLIRSSSEEIRRAYSSYLSSKKEMEAYKKALELAEKSHSLVLQEYRFKQANSFDVLNSLSNLNQTKESWIRSKIQMDLNRILLGISTGEFPEGANHWQKGEKKDDTR